MSRPKSDLLADLPVFLMPLLFVVAVLAGLVMLVGWGEVFAFFLDMAIHALFPGERGKRRLRNST